MFLPNHNKAQPLSGLFWLECKFIRLKRELLLVAGSGFDRRVGFIRSRASVYSIFGER